MYMPKKIFLISEDGKEEINLQNAIKYCGEAEVFSAITKGANCTLKDTLEFEYQVQFKF